MYHKKISFYINTIINNIHFSFYIFNNRNSHFFFHKYYIIKLYKQKYKQKYAFRFI